MYIDWRLFMDWALLCSMFVLLAAFIIDIVKSVKDSKNLSDEHKNISETIKEQRCFLEKDTQQIISQNNKQAEKTDDISEKISDLDKLIYGEIQKNKTRYNNLSSEQQNARKQVEAFNFLFDEVTRLQNENNLLKLKNSSLQAENDRLSQTVKNYETHRRRNTPHK